jgi:putative Ca2+/H+ antiporter (TMEM165/GDT1 family)
MVFLGEMGDKSQLLAMAFAGRFGSWRVMLGVALAALLNQGLAVAAGTYLSTVIPMNVVSIAAGALFLAFGLLTLRGDEGGDERRRESRLGPVATVALTFFLAEMGDKTQVATVALAAEYCSPVPVLAGTVGGMILADGVGVGVGDLLRRRISPKWMRLMAAGIFLLFGCITLVRALIRIL